MNSAATNHGDNTAIFLLMLILNLVTGLNYANIAEHTINAIITAVIWLVFKIIADHLSGNKNQNIKNG